MSEHPLTLNSNQLGQVRALLDGTKTKHRMLIKPQPDTDEFEGPEWGNPEVVDRHGMLAPGKATFALWGPEWHIKCPWLVGDRLWVRETWANLGEDHDRGKSLSGKWLVGTIAYRAGTTNPSTFPGPWKPSIFMPRWASRITLEITAIRAERVKAMQEWEAICEGIDYRCPACGYTHRDAHEQMDHRLCKEHPMPNAVMIFVDLWDSINQKRGFGWDDNPWVWVLEFRRIKP